MCNKFVNYIMHDLTTKTDEPKIWYGFLTDGSNVNALFALLPLSNTFFSHNSA